MNKIKGLSLVLGVLLLLVSCGGVSNKTVIRHQKLEDHDLWIRKHYDKRIFQCC